MKRIALEDTNTPRLAFPDPRGARLFELIARRFTPKLHQAISDYCGLNETHAGRLNQDNAMKLVRVACIVREVDRKSFFAELSDKTPAQVEDALDEIERRAYFEGLRT